MNTRWGFFYSREYKHIQTQLFTNGGRNTVDGIVSYAYSGVSL